jgi:hypothetical protein
MWQIEVVLQFTSYSCCGSNFPWTAMSWQWSSASDTILLLKNWNTAWTLFLDHSSSQVAMFSWYVHAISGRWQETQYAVLPTMINKFLWHTHSKCMSFGYEIICVVSDWPLCSLAVAIGDSISLVWPMYMPMFHVKSWFYYITSLDVCWS